jgi:hypothetical protein
VTLTIPITTTPPSEGILVPLIIPMVPLQTVVPQLDTELPLERLQAYYEEQQARASARSIDAKHMAMQQQGELVGERAAIEDKLTELHPRSGLGHHRRHQPRWGDVPRLHFTHALH